MNSKFIIAGTAAFLMSAWALADEPEDDGPENEATIRLMELHNGDLPEAVTNEITLPDTALDSAAVERTADRLDTAIGNLARRHDGIAQARDALSDALENQENRGRSSNNVPDSRPDPGPPSD